MMTRAFILARLVDAWHALRADCHRYGHAWVLTLDVERIYLHCVACGLDSPGVFLFKG